MIVSAEAVADQSLRLFHLRSSTHRPLDLDVILNFFGWLIEVKHKDKPAAFSTVRQCKSALVWLYKEEKTIFPANMSPLSATVVSTIHV
jgi:hypothetical protein